MEPQRLAHPVLNTDGTWKFVYKLADIMEGINKYRWVIWCIILVYLLGLYIFKVYWTNLCMDIEIDSRNQKFLYFNVNQFIVMKNSILVGKLGGFLVTVEFNIFYLLERNHWIVIGIIRTSSITSMTLCSKLSLFTTVYVTVVVFICAYTSV